MDYAEAIKQDVQALLLIENVEVTSLESKDDRTIPVDMIRFGILIGKGKKGGLLFSADVHKTELATALNNCILMIRSQLVLYAVSCLENGYIAPLQDIYMPNVTHTLVFSSNTEANNQAAALSAIVGTFNIFEGTYFSGAKIPVYAKTKPVKAPKINKTDKTTKKKTNGK